MRKIFAFCFILSMFCFIGIAQNTQPPAYVIMQAYSIPLNDKVCEPLTYIDSETGKGNLVATLVDAVKNKQIVAYSYQDDTELSWDEVQDALGRSLDTTYVVDYELNGKFITGDLVVESPHDLSNICFYDFLFLAEYDKNKNLLQRELTSITLSRKKYDLQTGNFKGFEVAFYLKMSDSNFRDLLVKNNSSMPGYLHKSFLQVINDFMSIDLLEEYRYASCSAANSMLNDTLFSMPNMNKHFEYPIAISNKKSRIVVRKVLLPIENLGHSCLTSNYFLPIFGNSVDMIKESADISAYPLFYPSGPAGCGYVSVSRHIANESMSDILSFYAYDSLNFFRTKMDTETVKSCFTNENFIEVQTPTSENPDSVIYFSIREKLLIAGFYILELRNGKSAIPLGLCPLVLEGGYDESKIKFSKPVCWIPFNAAFRQMLQQQEAYWPENLPAMSLWDYFCANYYGGEIISEQKITQAEWTKMLEVLK